MAQKKTLLPTKAWMGLIIILLSIQFAQGLLFLQDQTDISESYTAEQTTVITLLNDQPRSQNINIEISPQSKYLNQYITIENKAVTLVPGEKKNILIDTLFIENDLSPETHIIELIAKSDDGTSSAKTQITFNVPGIPRPELRLNSENFDLEGEEKTLTIELENTGNVILRPKPTIILSKRKEIIKTIEYKTPLQIMPQEIYPITLRIETNSLEEDSYEVKVTFPNKYNLEVETQTKKFKITKTLQVEEQNNTTNTPLFIFGILTLLILGLFLVNKELKKEKNPSRKNIKQLEKKEKHLNKELETLINKTHQTINNTNKWIKKNLGEKYELK